MRTTIAKFVSVAVVLGSAGFFGMATATPSAAACTGADCGNYCSCVETCNAAFERGSPGWVQCQSRCEDMHPPFDCLCP
jgi:hypothetical protein